MKKKIFTLFSILVFMGAHSASGKEQTEADGPEPRKESYVQNTGNSDLLLKNQENFKIPISKWRYITGGVLATSPSLFVVTGLLVGMSVPGVGHYSFFYAMIPGSFGIPRAVQGRYWPKGFLFTAIQGGLLAMFFPCFSYGFSCDGKACDFVDACSLISLLGSIATIVYQPIDAWILSSAYELAEKNQWGITPTYSYSKETDSNSYGLALQYLW